MSEIRQTADFVSTQWLAIWLGQTDVDEHEEVGLDRLFAAACEEVTENWQVAENWDLVFEALELLLDESAHDDGFVIVDDNCSLDFTLCEDRHGEDHWDWVAFDDSLSVVGAVIADEIGDGWDHIQIDGV